MKAFTTKFALSLASLLFLIGLMGCAEKNFSKKKPGEHEVDGIWMLDADSRTTVSASYRIQLSDKDGKIEIHAGGLADVSNLPLMDAHSKPILVTGSGKWSFAQYGEIWKLVITVEDTKTQRTNLIPMNIGHDGSTAFLNQPIDDPDGEVMRFRRSQ